MMNAPPPQSTPECFHLPTAIFTKTNFRASRKMFALPVTATLSAIRRHSFSTPTFIFLCSLHKKTVPFVMGNWFLINDLIMR